MVEIQIPVCLKELLLSEVKNFQFRYLIGEKRQSKVTNFLVLINISPNIFPQSYLWCVKFSQWKVTTLLEVINSSCD